VPVAGSGDAVATALPWLDHLRVGAAASGHRPPVVSIDPRAPDPHKIGTSALSRTQTEFADDGAVVVGLLVPRAIGVVEGGVLRLWALSSLGRIVVMAVKRADPFLEEAVPSPLLHKLAIS
jgi:hypothetical protein